MAGDTGKRGKRRPTYKWWRRLATESNLTALAREAASGGLPEPNGLDRRSRSRG